MAATTILTFSLIIFSLLHVSSAASATTSTPAANFIRTSCRATAYPAVCVNSLSPYAASINRSPKQLVMTALTVSVDKARSTKSFVANLTKSRGLKPREHVALKDCLDLVSQSIYELGKSVKELKKMGPAKGPEFVWHMDNVLTWVTGAGACFSTCEDGFAGRASDGIIKSSVKARMTSVAQVTNNAFRLCYEYARDKLNTTYN